MAYDISPATSSWDPGGVFQSIAIGGIISVQIGLDARNPLDNDDYIIPKGTPMAPVHRMGTDVHDDGNSHNLGLWMPIRRSLWTADAATTITVVDADPFHVGDIVHTIDATGPVTGGGIDLGIVTAVDYTTDVVTVQNTPAAAAAGDWLEVIENGAAYAATPTRWMNPMTVGMLKDDTDVRSTLDDTTGVPTMAEVVVHGSIREADINFSDDATDDLILMVQMGGGWNLGGGIRIITGRHGAEAVDVPDWSDLAT